MTHHSGPACVKSTHIDNGLNLKVQVDPDCLIIRPEAVPLAKVYVPRFDYVK